jgi:glycosyltransferase involved in cell wall biosynthesis
MRPAKTLLIVHPNSPYPPDPAPFGDVWGTVTCGADGSIDPRLLEALCEGLDVLWTAETPYDFRAYPIARQAGVRSVCHVMPELFPYATPEMAGWPRPDRFWLPTGWRADTIPDAEVVPVPVDRERFPPRKVTRAATFVHVAGHQAMADRNGTRLVAAALRYVCSQITFVVRAQQRIPPSWFRHISSTVTFRLEHADLPDERGLYAGADVLVQPRRYGGLSLVMNEAASCGIPILTIDMDPQRDWFPDAALIPVLRYRTVPMQGGPIPIAEVDPRAIAARIDACASDDTLVEKLSDASDDYAASIDWRALRPVWEQALCR